MNNYFGNRDVLKAAHESDFKGAFNNSGISPKINITVIRKPFKTIPSDNFIEIFGPNPFLELEQWRATHLYDNTNNLTGDLVGVAYITGGGISSTARGFSNCEKSIPRNKASSFVFYDRVTEVSADKRRAGYSAHEIAHQIGYIGHSHEFPGIFVDCCMLFASWPDKGANQDQCLNSFVFCLPHSNYLNYQLNSNTLIKNITSKK